MQRQLTVAALPLNIVANSPERNYQRVADLLASEGAAMQHADIIVVPETFTTGFTEAMVRLAEPTEGATLDFARDMAHLYGALFVGSWAVREGDEVYNRMYWVRPDGTYGYYDKAHTFRVSFEHDVVARGARRTTFEWRGWCIRPAVCYDLRFPTWLRNEVCAERGAEESAFLGLDYDLLLLTANWPASRQSAWNTLLKARAVENLSYVLGVNRSGEDEHGSAHNGDCLVVDYKGNELTTTQPGKECPLVATLEAEPLLQFRKRWPFYLDFDRQVPPIEG